MKSTFFQCLLGSMVVQWDINGKLLCLQINSKRMFTSVTLLSRSFNLGTIPETVFVFSFFFKDTNKSSIDFVIGCSFCFEIVSTYVKYYLL